MRTIREFLEEYPVQLTSVKVPDRADVDWPGKGASHYACILIHGGRHLFTYFSMGGACHKPPNVATILDSLASDTASAESCDTFSSWCSEFGYSNDSRTAHRTFQACRRSAKDLRRLLGEVAYNNLVSRTERS